MLLYNIQSITGQCRLTCLQTGNEIEASSYSKVWSPSSLVFIMDTTESMINELYLVQREINNILGTINQKAADRACNPIDTYNIYPFNDPYVGPMYIANTIEGFRENFAEVGTQVSGGGDCPEPVLTAVLNVLDNITDNSFVFIFTDGAAKDARKKLEVIRKIQQTNSYVVFVLIGDHCSNEGLDYISTQLYNQISHASGGNAIFVKRTESTVGNVVKLISLFVKPKSVAIIDINQFTPSDCINIPVDSSLCDLVVTIKNPTFNKVGKASLQSPENDRTIRHDLRTRSVKAWEIDVPTAGNWQICFGRSRGRELSLQVRGSSDIEFKVIVREWNSRTELEVVRGGEMVEIELTIFGISTNKVRTVNFIDLGGIVIQSLGFRKQTSVIFISGAELPSGIFKIQIKGTDNRGNAFQRISNGIFGEPKEPTWVVEPSNKVYAVLRNSFTIEVVVTGDPFPNVVWKKDNVVLNANNRIQLAREGTLTLSRVIDTDIGIYQITAYNEVGNVTKNIELALWTAPYFTREPIKHIVKPINSPVIIDLSPQGNPEPTCRWLHEGSAIQTETHCQLVLDSLNDQNCGEYKVIIENSVATILISIDVTFQPICFLDVCHYEPPNSGSTLMLQTNCLGCPTRCLWYRNNEEITTKEKYTIHNNCSLKIHNYQSADQGSYNLNLLNKDDNIVKGYVLKVIPSHSLSIIEPEWEETLVQAGTVYTVICRAEGSPLPTLSWLRNDRPISKSIPMCTEDTTQTLGLNFERIQNGDEGEYKCIATNKFGSEEKTISINVNSTLDVLVSPVGANVIIGDVMYIHCQITNRGHMPATITWYKMESELQDNDRITKYPNNTLRFSPVLEEDEDNYECRAITTREVTSGFSELITTPKTFYYKPLDADRDRICLKCPRLAGQNPSWKRGETQLVDNDKYTINARRREICITNADCDDEGTYTCESAYSMPVRLRDTENICENLVRQRTRFRNRQKALVIAADSTAVMRCNVTGVPPPNIDWFKNGDEPIMNDHRTTISLKSSYTPGDTSYVYRSKVVIQHITLEDQGDYSCNSTQPRLGYANHTFLMQVTISNNAKIPEFSGKSENTRVCEGEHFSIFCDFDSTLAISSYIWYFDGTPITASNNIIITNENNVKRTTLQVNSPATTQTGSYTCEARNLLGSRKDSIHVEVVERRENEIVYFSGDTTAYIGTEQVLYCRVESNSPAIEIIWYKDNTEEKARGERLIFESVENSDEGSYTCRVVGCGSNVEETLYLQIREMAAPLLENQILQLHGRE
ncbi:Hemicentin-2-like [Oopsacas minuta]|uniref:Hemicentin-2-like n=1 Tax=Oopsacas minuta TaxID=111878 RepID=A0AAV7JCS1_9METZ|nr:Hemicentin-2-like [Oopsacas minuta]